jgi:hypothetical protein
LEISGVLLPLAVAASAILMADTLFISHCLQYTIILNNYIQRHKKIFLPWKNA